MVAFPDAKFGVDYVIACDGPGKPERVVMWTLPQPAPATQTEVDAILSAHVDDIADREARNHSSFPTLEQRVTALEAEAGGMSATDSARASALRSAAKASVLKRLTGRKAHGK
jgi:hypothetical protein